MRATQAHSGYTLFDAHMCCLDACNANSHRIDFVYVHKSLQYCPVRSGAQLCLVLFRCVLGSNVPLLRGAGFSRMELAFVRHALKVFAYLRGLGASRTIHSFQQEPC